MIPQASLEKPPSAELRPDQKDSDTLPPYEVLDAILEDYVEESHTAEQIAADRGYRSQSGAARHPHGGRARVQAAAGGAGTENFGESLRLRSPLSHRRQNRRVSARPAQNLDSERNACIILNSCYSAPDWFA